MISYVSSGLLVRINLSILQLLPSIGIEFTNGGARAVVVYCGLNYYVPLRVRKMRIRDIKATCLKRFEVVGSRVEYLLLPTFLMISQTT
jgi:hypothetical protein